MGFKRHENDLSEAAPITYEAAKSDEAEDGALDSTEPHAWALLPILVFLVLFIGAGVVLKDFYAMPAIVAFLIALVVAFIQNRKVKLDEKLRTVARSMGNETVMIMVLIFVLAGAFSGAVTSAGGVTSTVNLGLSILPPNIVVPGLFLIACFISLSMGTSVGTIAALAPIAIGVSDAAAFSPALCIAAIVCGAMFGDNLSFISDTTIAATRTQDCKMNDKFKENFKIALPAAIIAFVIFLALASTAAYEVPGDLSFNIWKVLPYLVVLVAALCGMNVFIVLVLGTVLSIIVGVVFGAFPASEMFTAIGTGLDGKGGIMNMYDIAVISVICAGIIGLVRANGGIAFILDAIKRRVKTKRGAELGIAVLSSAVDVSTANNTVAIVIAGPVAREIADEYAVSRTRTASILDIFTSVFQGIIPYGAQLLYACAGAAAVGASLLPTDIIPYLFYPFLLAVCALIDILVIAPLRDRRRASTMLD